MLSNELNGVERLHALLNERDRDHDGRAAEPGDAMHGNCGALGVLAAHVLVDDREPLFDNAFRWRSAVSERQILKKYYILVHFSTFCT